MWNLYVTKGLNDEAFKDKNGRSAKYKEIFDEYNSTGNHDQFETVKKLEMWYCNQKQKENRAASKRRIRAASKSK